jgi:hypothetical protein
MGSFDATVGFMEVEIAVLAGFGPGFVVSHPNDKNRNVARVGHPVLSVS